MKLKYTVEIEILPDTPANVDAVRRRIQEAVMEEITIARRVWVFDHNEAEEVDEKLWIHSQL